MTSKEEILNDLTNWELTFDRSFVKLISNFEKVEDFEEITATFGEEDTKEIIRSIIAMIKNNPNKWGIREDKYVFVPLGIEPNIIPIVPRKTHYKEGFTEEEWAEIETLNLKIYADSSFFKFYVSNNEEKKQGFFADVDWRGVTIVALGTLIVVLILIFLYRLIKSAFNS